MSDDRLADLLRVCEEAIAREGADRAAYLDTACGADVALRREVDAVLAEQLGAAAEFLDTPPWHRPTPALTAGQRLGPYEVSGKIGAGGMGAVYKARDTRLGRTVALKVIADASSMDPAARERFTREACTIAALSHPNICTLYDVGQHDGSMFLVMEHVVGETLADRLRNGALPLEEALTIATHIADALVVAHRAGVIHRDLKPGNVMLTKAGAKLLDFGLAKLNTTGTAAASIALSSLPAAEPATAAGTILGTIPYMAPEQLEGKEADARSDLWALGCLLYEMVAGRRAFEATSQASLIGAIMTAEAPPLPVVQPVVPRSLDHLVRTCLAKDPDERWQTASDVKRQLHWIADEHRILHTPGRAGGPVAAVPGPRRAFPKERATWAALVALLLVALAAMTILNKPLPPQTSPVARFEIPLPPRSELQSLAVSPDGRQLLFQVLESYGSPRIWLRSLDADASHPVPGTEGGMLPFWSPDGRSIAFFAAKTLKKMTLPDGAPMTICAAPNGRGGTWNSDGVIVFAPEGDGPLFRVSANGGTPTPLTRLDAAQSQRSHRFPQFLADGRRFLYFALPSRSGESGTNWVGSLDGDAAQQVVRATTEAVSAGPYLVTVQERALVAWRSSESKPAPAGEAVPIARPLDRAYVAGHAPFSVSANGTLAYHLSLPIPRQLVWVDRTGGAPARLGAPAAYRGMAITRKGDRLVLPIDGSDGTGTRLWYMTVATGRVSPASVGATVRPDSPAWSSQGDKVAYVVADAIVGETVETGAKENLLEQPQANATCKQPSFTPDGRLLVYAFWTGSDDWDIWAVPLIGPREPRSVVQAPGVQDDPQVSPDGQWLAYHSRESGRSEVRVQALKASSATWQVSAAGGTEPRWRSDGKELYFLDLDGKLMVVPVRDGPGWRGAPAQPLFDTVALLGSHAAVYVPASDGRRFLFDVAIPDSPPLTIKVVLNWFEALKPKITPRR